MPPRRPPRIGWFDSIVGAFVGAGVGLVLLFLSVALLWWNEGRPNLAEVAREAAVAPPERVDRALDGQLVSATARVTARDPLGDPQFLLPGDYVTLERHAEMFAWIEYNCRRDGKGRASCSYRRGWSAHPADSDGFHDPAGHHNPPMRFGPARFTADASVGVYHFATALAAMPEGAPVALSPEMIDPDAPEHPTLDAGYLYLGERSVATAAVGDLRLSYAAFRPDQLATLFGEQHGGEVLAHVTDDGQRFYRVLRGDRAAAIATLAMEHRVISWLLRVAGVALLWLALNLGLGPVSAMFDLIPWLGRASRSLVAAVTMPVALVLGTAVVLLSTAAHHPVRAALFLLAVACLLAWLRRRNGGRA